MRSPTSEFIWQGRLHLGDQPGIFGDAAYVGLSIELPVTLTITDSTGTAALRIHAESVQTTPPYAGHLVTVVSYQDGAAEVIGSARIEAPSDNQSDVDISVTLNVASAKSPVFTGVRIQVDTAVPPGLYDDFVISGLRLDSSDNAVVGELGFHS
jgi:hypothetical protein